MTNWTKATLAALLVAAAVGSGCGRGRPSAKPPIHPNPNMDSQEKYKPQAAAPFFHNNSAMRMPVEGTVARGNLGVDGTQALTIARFNHTVKVEDLSGWYTGKTAAGDPVSNPLPATKEVLARGRERYDVYCTPCHDYAGYGKGPVAVRTGLMVLSYHTPAVRERTDGYIFEIITKGSLSGLMQPYNDQVTVEDRWAIIHYVRALQRSQNPSASDLAATPAN